MSAGSSRRTLRRLRPSLALGRRTDRTTWRPAAHLHHRPAGKRQGTAVEGVAYPATWARCMPSHKDICVSRHKNTRITIFPCGYITVFQTALLAGCDLQGTPPLDPAHMTARNVSSLSIEDKRRELRRSDFASGHPRGGQLPEVAHKWSPVS